MAAMGPGLESMAGRTWGLERQTRPRAAMGCHLLTRRRMTPASGAGASRGQYEVFRCVWLISLTARADHDHPLWCACELLPDAGVCRIIGRVVWRGTGEQ